MESDQHIQLVNLIISYLKLHLVSCDMHDAICAETSDSSSRTEQTLEGFYPDVFYEYGDKLIIGEAKTSKDVDTRHSNKQYESYIQKCINHKGTVHLVVAVPWPEYIFMKNKFKRYKKQKGFSFKVHILCECMEAVI